jgi:peroxiredoxin
LIQVGDAAPGLTLPAANREGSVTLADYRDRQPVLLGLFRGLHCPFCRRHLVHFGAVTGKLQPLGVELIAVVNTPLERARLYVRHRPSPMLLLADANAVSHRAFAVPAPVLTPRTAGGRSEWPWHETVERMSTVRIDSPDESAVQLLLFEANDLLNQRDGFELTDADRHSQQAHGTQLIGYFAIDRDGVIRWRYLEAERRPEDIGTGPTETELLGAGRALAG